MFMKCVRWLMIVVLWALSGCNLNRLKQAKESLDSHDLAAAEKRYRAILESNPQEIEALAGLGWTYHLALKREDALSQFSYCLGIEPDNIECIRGKSSVILAQGDSKLARLWLDKALMIAPDDPEVLVSEAIWMLAQGEISKASRQLEMVIRRVPDNGGYRLPYAEALLREGRSKDALEQTELSLQSEIPRRTQAMVWILRARALLAISSSAGEDCSQLSTINAWVAEAERALGEAESTGVEVPNSAMINRQLGRRRTTLQEKCPMGQGGG